MRGLIQEQRRQVQSLQREVERLRADVETGGGKRTASKDRVTELESGTDARAHWPRITKCTRLLRAQQASVSSWQSGSSSP